MNEYIENLYGFVASDIIDGLDEVWIKVEKNGN